MYNIVPIEAQTALTAILFFVLLVTISILYIILSEEPSSETTTNNCLRPMSMGVKYKSICTECGWRSLYFDKEQALLGAERHYKNNTPKHTCKIKNEKNNDTDTSTREHTTDSR